MAIALPVPLNCIWQLSRYNHNNKNSSKIAWLYICRRLRPTNRLMTLHNCNIKYRLEKCFCSFHQATFAFFHSFNVWLLNCTTLPISERILLRYNNKLLKTLPTNFIKNLCHSMIERYRHVTSISLIYSPKLSKTRLKDSTLKGIGENLNLTKPACKRGWSPASVGRPASKDWGNLYNKWKRFRNTISAFADLELLF